MRYIYPDRDHTIAIRLHVYDMVFCKRKKTLNVEKEVYDTVVEGEEYQPPLFNLKQKIHDIRALFIHCNTIDVNSLMTTIYHDIFDWKQILRSQNITLHDLREAALCIILSISKDVLELPENVLRTLISASDLLPEIWMTDLYKPNKRFLTRVKSLIDQGLTFYSVNSMKNAVFNIVSDTPTHHVTAESLKLTHEKLSTLLKDNKIDVLDSTLSENEKTLLIHKCLFNSVQYEHYNEVLLSILFNHANMDTYYVTKAYSTLKSAIYPNKMEIFNPYKNLGLKVKPHADTQ